MKKTVALLVVLSLIVSMCGVGFADPSEEQVMDKVKFTSLSQDFDLIEPQFSQELLFNKGLAPVKIGSDYYNYINKKGEVVLKTSGSPPINWLFEDVAPFTDEFAAVKKDGKWKFVNKDGVFLTSPKDFNEIEMDASTYFTEGLAPIRQNNLWGFINAKGEMVVEPIYQDARNFSEGLAAVQMSDKWGYIDKTGEIIVELQYDYADLFREGRAIVGSVSKVIPDNGYVNKVYKYSVIDSSGSILNGDIDGKAYGFEQGFADVEKGYKHGFIDKNGELILEPQFDNWVFFYEGYAAVKVKDKWGFVDTTGKMAIEPRFDNAGYFSEGLAPVEVNGKLGFVDKSGKMVISPEFEAELPFCFPFHKSVPGGVFKQGLVPVKKDGKWGVIDKTGKIIINPKFDAVSGFTEGLAVVFINGNAGIIDRKGNILVEPQFDFVWDFKDGVAQVKKDDKIGAIIDRRTKVEVGGKLLDLDVVPKNINGRLLVPLRAIFEALGATVEWDGNTGTVKAQKGSEIAMELTINSNKAKVNGKAVTLEVPAQIVDSRTLVPLRFVSESMNAKVDWDNENRIAKVSIPDNEAEDVLIKVKSTEKIENFSGEYWLSDDKVLGTWRNEDSSYFCTHDISDKSITRLSDVPAYAQILSTAPGGKYAVTGWSWRSPVQASIVSTDKKGDVVVLNSMSIDESNQLWEKYYYGSVWLNDGELICALGNDEKKALEKFDIRGNREVLANISITPEGIFKGGNRLFFNVWNDENHDYDVYVSDLSGKSMQKFFQKAQMMAIMPNEKEFIVKKSNEQKATLSIIDESGLEKGNVVENVGIIDAVISIGDDTLIFAEREEDSDKNYSTKYKAIGTKEKKIFTLLEEKGWGVPNICISPDSSKLMIGSNLLYIDKK